MKTTKTMAKITSLILAALLMFSFVSCEGGMNESMDAVDGDIGAAGTPDGGYKDHFSPSYPSYDEEIKDEVAGDDANEEGDAEAGDPGENENIPGEKPDNSPSFNENPFINTSDNNVSTFSADVDTASYSYFRKMVSKGYTLQQLINNGSVFRTEEFINYFRYSVPQPAENELFGVKTELSPCPWSSDSLILRLTLQAEQAVSTGGNNLVFLIDVSGSMSSADKLPLLKRAFSYLVDNLDADDTVSIVTYSGREAVVLDGCNGLESSAIMNAINTLSASGSTNGEAGLTMAYQIAEKHFKADGNNRIIMASDGDLNVGISSADQLTAYIEEKRDQGIYLSVLGFGTGNYKDDNMEALADNGNGVYYYVDGESEAEKVFGTDLVGTLYTVAEDVKLQLEFNSERIDSYRLIGYENRKMANEDFENDAKDAGEVGASHQVTVCYEIKLKENCEADMSAPFMTLRVRYKNPGEDMSLLNEYTISDEMSDIGDDQRFINSVVQLCMILHNSSYLGDITVDSVLEDLDSLNLTDSYKIEFREMVRALAQ